MSMTVVSPPPHPLVRELLEAQEARYYSQNELARELDVDSSTITHWKRGTTPRPKALRAIVAWLNKAA